MNHWVSADGPSDVCMACGESVPNVGQAEPPVIITGQCKGAAPIRVKGDLVLVVCTKCAHGPPYFDAAYLDVTFGDAGIRAGRPGWCQKCRKFIGDVYSVVPARPPAADLVQAFVDAAGALVER